MGWKYEVEAYTRHGETLPYAYEAVYFGPSLIKAIQAMRKARKAGSGCVRLSWR